MWGRPEPPVVERINRRRQVRRFAAVVTLPGLLLGSASIAAAYGTGLLHGPQVTTPCTPTVVTAPARNSFPVNVLNSNETAGQGGEVARALTKRGFDVVSVANAPNDIYITKSAIIYYGAKGRENALLMQKQIPGSALWNDGRTGPSVDVVIGYGFTKLVNEPPPPPPKPFEIRVNVYNTTWHVGLAADVAKKLEKRGFTIEDVGNDPNRAFLPHEVAMLRFGPDGAAAAKELALQIPGVQTVQDQRSGPVVDLVIGNKYTHLTPLKDLPKPKPTMPLPAETVTIPCPAG